ncbi:MAG: TonB-dependent receptor, partial [Candidatus Neomarinimicrobiota bacterium]
MPKKFHSRWRLPSALLLPLLLSPLMAMDRFHGRVTDADTRQGIAGVNVVLVGTVAGTLTDAEGRFSLGVQPGAVLRLTHIAYDELEWTVTAEQLRAARIQAFSMSPRLLHGEPVFVTATRGEAGQTPVAFSTLGHDELTAAAPFEDVPMALAGLPGVYAFSDAGHGVGYTYLKIRGFDQDRIGVMINGIPLNDPESHQVYWVDHGDILAGSGSVQVQRGVGSSLYGSAAMGGSVNMVTSPRATPRGLTLQTGYGDFTDAGFSPPSRKFAVQWTGLPLTGRALTLHGRYSGIRSDGYRLGSGTRQDALHLIGEHLRPLSSTRLELITGAEVTHFSWDGIAPLFDLDLADRVQRRYNYYA